jgi:DNA-binding CsgD family transcriptional regulator
MRIRPPFQPGHPALSNTDSDIPSSHRLIRLLVDMALKSEDLRCADNQDQDEDVLVDTELDGCRYLLVRLPKATHARVALSPREKEIVRMVAQGHPNKVIAGVLNISGWTVCTHLRRIFAKLGVGSRAAMVAKLLDSRNPDSGIRNSDKVDESTNRTKTSRSLDVAPEQAIAARSGRR